MMSTLAFNELIICEDFGDYEKDKYKYKINILWKK